MFSSTPFITALGTRFYGPNRESLDNILIPWLDAALSLHEPGRPNKPTIIVAIDPEQDRSGAHQWIIDQFGDPAKRQKNDPPVRVQGINVTPWWSGMSAINVIIAEAGRRFEERDPYAMLMFASAEFPPTPERVDCLKEHFKVVPDRPKRSTLCIGAQFAVHKFNSHRVEWAPPTSPRNTFIAWSKDALGWSGIPHKLFWGKEDHPRGMEERLMAVNAISSDLSCPQLVEVVQLPEGPLDWDMSLWDEARKERHYAKFRPGGVEELMMQAQEPIVARRSIPLVRYRGRLPRGGYYFHDDDLFDDSDRPTEVRAEERGSLLQLQQ